MTYFPTKALLLIAALFFIVPQSESQAARQLEIEKLGLEVNSVTYAKDGSFYGLDVENKAGKFVLSPRKRWFNLQGRFSKVVGHPNTQEIWAFDGLSGDAFRFNKSFWAKKGNVNVRDISINSDGDILALSLDNKLMRWHKSKEQWQEIGAGYEAVFTQISAIDRSRSWALDDAGQLYLIDKKKIRATPFSGFQRLLFDDRTSQVFLSDGSGQLSVYTPALNKLDKLDTKDGYSLQSLSHKAGILLIDEQANLYQASVVTKAESINEKDAPVIASKETKKSTKQNQQKESVQSTEPFSLKLFKVDALMHEIAIGADGRIFGAENAGDIKMWSNAKKTFFTFPGSAKAMAVGPKNELWALSNTGNLSFFDGEQWKSTSFSEGIDVFVMPDGQVFVSNQDEELFIYNRKTKRFKKQKQNAYDFTIDAEGNLWTVRKNGDLYKCSPKSCVRLPGRGQHIEIGLNGLILMVSHDQNLFRYLPEQKRWDLVRKNISDVAIGPDDQAWLIEKGGQIYATAYFDRDEKRDQQIAVRAQKLLERNQKIAQASGTSSSSTSSTFTFSKNMDFENVSFEGSATPRILQVGGSTAYAISSDKQTLWKYDSDKDKFKIHTDLPQAAGTSIYRIGVTPEGYLWIIYNDNTIYRPKSDDSWKKITGLSFTPKHIDVSHSGLVVVSDTSGNLFTYDADKDKFESFDNQDGNSAGDLSLDADGDPWIYATGGYLMEFTSKDKFEFRPKDKSQKIDNMGVCGNSDVYISEEVGGSGRLLKWNESNSDFDAVNLPSGVSALWVDCDADGRPWFISTSNTFYRADK